MNFLKFWFQGTDVFLLSNRKGSTEIEVQLNDLEFQENISTTAEYIDKATYVLRVPGIK